MAYLGKGGALTAQLLLLCNFWDIVKSPKVQLCQLGCPFKPLVTMLSWMASCYLGQQRRKWLK